MSAKSTAAPTATPTAVAPAAERRAATPVESFADVQVVARIVLPPSTLTLDALAHMEAGFVLHLGIRAGGVAELWVNGQPLAEGRVVSVGGQRAFSLAEVL